jgi:hypothetical protein
VRVLIGIAVGLLLSGIVLALWYSALPSEPCHLATALSCKALDGRQYVNLGEFVSHGPAPLAYACGLVGGGLVGLVSS